MNIKNLLPDFGPQVSLEQSIFNLINFVSALFSLFFVIVSLAIGLLWDATIYSGLGALIYSTFYILSRFQGYYRYLMVPYLLFSLFLCSQGWFYSGGLKGQVPYFFIIAFTIFMVSFSAKGRIIASILVVLNLAGLIIIEYLYPQLIRVPPTELAFTLNFIFTIFLVLLVMFVLIEIVRQRYEIERQTVQKQNQSLKEATRAKSRFLANMSHEIRTPMNGVIGMTELLGKTDLDLEQKDYLETIQTSGRRLLGILNEILDLSKIEAGAIRLEHKAFSIDSCIQEAVNISIPKIMDKNIQLKYSTSPSNIWVLGDMGKIQQILINLIDNAIKFTTEGIIEVRLELEQLNLIESKVTISVEDKGVGISKENLNLLFKEFSQIDNSNSRSYGGSGLGLAIVKKLTEMMSGEVFVNSDLGVGSSFGISIPMALISPPPQLKTQAEITIDQLPKALKILVAEDDRINQKLAKNIFKRLGYEIDLAKNGIEAIEMAKQKDYQLIFMDIHMPEVDGIQATINIFEHAEIPPTIIAMTANVLDDDKQACFEVGMFDYLTKPVTIHDIKQAILAYHTQSD